jgi:hydrogenase expression/formation protein HypD
VVIAGFEPLDVMQAILMLVRQVNDGRAEVENEFTRAVTDDGNLKAQALMADVFALRESFEWRGLGVLPRSALRIHERYAAFDAEARFGLVYVPVADHKACECGPILRGVKAPLDCKLFGTVYARHADGGLHGVLRGRLRRPLHLRACPRRVPH